MAKANGRKKRDRGGIDVLPSGAIRVRVYAGIDPVSKRRMLMLWTASGCAKGRTFRSTIVYALCATRP